MGSISALSLCVLLYTPTRLFVKFAISIVFMMSPLGLRPIQTLHYPHYPSPGDAATSRSNDNPVHPPLPDLQRARGGGDPHVRSRLHPRDPLHARVLLRISLLVQLGGYLHHRRGPQLHPQPPALPVAHAPLQGFHPESERARDAGELGV